MKIKVIKTDDEYEAALSQLEKLMEAEPAPDTPAYDRMDLLALLIQNYEDRMFPVDIPDPVEAIKFRMEQLELTRKDLEKYLGSRGKVSEVLNGKRGLSLSMIKALYNGLGIPANILLGKS